MFNRNCDLVILTAMLLLCLSSRSDAALFVGTDADTTLLHRFELSVSLWGPKSRTVFGLKFLDRCQLLWCVRNKEATMTESPKWLMSESVSAATVPTPKQAALSYTPRLAKPRSDRLFFAAATLAPMAHTVFCLTYPRDCEVKTVALADNDVHMTAQRWHDLGEINGKVNRGIRPERNLAGLAGEKWIVNPRAGDCNDYAVSKRHELLARGWPSRALLLAEVVTHWGEHHLILVVRTSDGDFVLDNLDANIRPWSQAPYRWVRVQSPQNPKYWFKVRTAGV